MKKILLIAGVLLCGTSKVEAAESAAAKAPARSTNLRIETVFTPENWNRVPYPSGVTDVEYSPEVLGSETLNFGGREWRLMPKNTEDLHTVLDGGYEVKLLADEAVFERALFEVDSAFYLQYTLVLVSTTAVYPISEEDGGRGFFKNAVFTLTTPLTADEQDNPIMESLKLPGTFQERSDLFASNPDEFKERFLMKQLQNMKHFMTEAGLAEYRKALVDGGLEITDASAAAE